MDVTDPLTWVILASALVAMATAVLHLYGWLPKRYTTRLRDVQAGLAQSIGVEVENALERVAAHQQASYEAAAKAAAVEAEKQGKSLQMSGTRQIGLEKAQMKELQGIMVDGMLGPVMTALEAWNPAWAEKLRNVDPSLLLQFLESPWFQTNIMPRIQPYLSKFLGSKTEGGTSDNPFLKGLGP